MHEVTAIAAKATNAMIKILLFIFVVFKVNKLPGYRNKAPGNSEETDCYLWNWERVNTKDREKM